MTAGFQFNAFTLNGALFNTRVPFGELPVANVTSTGSHGGGFAGSGIVFTSQATFGGEVFGGKAFDEFDFVLVPGGPGSPELTDNGHRVLRVGDIYLCPIHGPNPIVVGSIVWKDNGSSIARLNDRTACGAIITPPGSPEWSSE